MKHDIPIVTSLLNLLLQYRTSTRNYSIDILNRLLLYLTSDITLKLSVTESDGLQTAFLTPCDGAVDAMSVTVCDATLVCRSRSVTLPLFVGHGL